MSTQRPSMHKALLLTSRRGPFVVGKNRLSQPSSRQLVVKVKATALNHIDWMIQKLGIVITEFPSVLGMDLAGEVVAVGRGVTKFSVGDRVFCQGAFTNDYGSFQEYALADEFHLAKIPPNITYDQAATIPFTLTTAFCGMYNRDPHGMGLTSPAVDPPKQDRYKGEPFIVLGGSSSVGQFAIQLAKLSGFSFIITTASTARTDFLKNLGATHVLDRHLPTNSLKEQIRKITNKPIKYVYAAVSTSETQHTGIEIVSRGGYLVVTSSPEVSSPGKHVIFVASRRQPEPNRTLLEGMYKKLEEWVADGVIQIQPNKVDLLPGGLAGIDGGLQQVGDGHVSGVKLVVRPEETPTNL